MPIIIDPALRAMPEFHQREFERDLARGGRRGPISDAILPLNSALLARQQRIDTLEAQLAAAKRLNDQLAKPAADQQAWQKAIARAQAELPEGYTIAVGWTVGDCDFYLAGPDGAHIEVTDYDSDHQWVNRCVDAAVAHFAKKVVS